MSMTIGAISSRPAQQVHGGGRPTGPPPPPPGGAQGGGAVKTAAEALDLTEDELLEQLKSGKSMSDVAQAQNVSTEDLAAALKKDMPEELAKSGNADEIVASIMNQTGLPAASPSGGRRGFAAERIDGSTSGVLGGSLSESQRSTLQSLSTLLDTDSESLVSSLRSGTSLSDLLSAKGVTATHLSGANGLLIDATA